MPVITLSSLTKRNYIRSATKDFLKFDITCMNFSNIVLLACRGFKASLPDLPNTVQQIYLLLHKIYVQLKNFYALILNL